MITRIEELSMNAWPALQTLLYDGWILRLANRYTKRANSVNPLYGSTEQVEEKIQACEWFYRHHRMPVVFKMTPSVSPADLDEILAERGYRSDSPTSVQTLVLTGLVRRPSDGSEIHAALSEDWLSDFFRMSQTDDRHKPTLRHMLGDALPQRGFASLRRGGRAVACGMGVVEDGHLGLFDLVTDAGLRNRGYGKGLLFDLLEWGQRRGAHTAYLQVMLDNAPALHLYAKVGFKEAYRYWYRIGS